ncbi:MAG: hypothetical protein U1E37_01700 [Sphingomonadaceae bacterium]
MSFGDFMGLLAAVSGVVAITAIFTSHLRRRMEHKERIAELKVSGGSPSAPSPERDATIERLEHRIRVLERIATDKTATLAAQIEDLRGPAQTESLRDA